jgi:hypothetical protein
MYRLIYAVLQFSLRILRVVITVSVRVKTTLDGRKAYHFTISSISVICVKFQNVMFVIKNIYTKLINISLTGMTMVY